MNKEEFWSILHLAPVPKPVSYRLYHTDNGAPIIYSMEDLPGNYIEVDPATYALAPFNIRVVDNKIVYIKPVVTVKKLRPAVDNGIACDPRDVCVVVTTDQAHTKWSLKTNETN
jgi:hypothetical protein